MNHYENLATLAVRWMAVGFFVLAFISILFTGSMVGMGSMWGGDVGAMSDHMGGTMQGGAWMWLGPTVLPLVIGLLLWAVSRPVGRAMAAGLTGSPVEDVSATETSALI